MGGGTMASIKRLEDFGRAYRKWLDGIFDPDGRYTVLFDYLYGVSFRHVLDRDVNWEENGRYLRWRFAERDGWDCPDEYLSWDCSVLEALASMAFKIEEQILYDPEAGDRKAVWFWDLMGNLGLDTCDDEFMENVGKDAFEYTDEVLDCWLERIFDEDGTGSPFPLAENHGNCREMDMWRQLNLYVMETWM